MPDVMKRTWWACKVMKSKNGMDGRWQVECEEDAILISSLTELGKHAPCLDFDFPCDAIGSTLFINPGHLRTTGWDNVCRALDAAGILIYHGFASHKDLDGMHAVFRLVFNCPIRLNPSSTKGHFHLYIDAEITWEQYEPVIWALREAKLLEYGFADNSIKRRMTMLIRPGLTKDDLEAKGVEVESSGETDDLIPGQPTVEDP